MIKPSSIDFSRVMSPNIAAFAFITFFSDSREVYPGGSSISTGILRNTLRKAKAAIFGDITLEKSIELGLIICGSPATARQALESYWKDMRFGNLLVLCQFGTLPADLTHRNMELFAREVMPAVRQLTSKAVPA